MLTIAGILLAAIGAALAGFALFADRARGRRRCPKCWYSMDGVPGLTCPECGRTVRADARLLRTRRRWHRAAAGTFVLLLGAALIAAPRLMSARIAAALPRPVLMTLLSADDSPFLAEEAFDRVLDPATGTIGWPQWQIDVVARRAAESLRSLLSRGDFDAGFLVANPWTLKDLMVLRSLGSSGRSAIPVLTRASPDAQIDKPFVDALAAVGSGDDRATGFLGDAIISARTTHTADSLQALARMSTTPAQQDRFTLVLTACMAADDPGTREGALWVAASVAPALERIELRRRIGDAAFALVAGPTNAPTGTAVEIVAICCPAPSLAVLIGSDHHTLADRALQESLSARRFEPEVLAAAASVLTSRGEARCRFWAAGLLGESPDPTPYSAVLVDATHDPDREVRMAALWAIRRLADPAAAIEAAVRCAREGPHEVTNVALNVLESLTARSPEAGAALQALAGDADSSLAAAAQRRLRPRPPGPEAGSPAAERR